MASYRDNKLSRKGLGMNAQEEEEMDRILKGAGMYEHGMSFADKKDLVKVLNDSKDTASPEQLEAVEKVSTPSTSKSNLKSSVTSSDQHSANAGASTSRVVKPPKSDSDEEEFKQQDEQRKRWKPNQPRTPQNTYASRMLAASANKNGTPNKGQILASDLLAPKKLDNLKISDDKIEELLSDVSSPEQETAKEKNVMKKEEPMDGDATPPHPFELDDSDQPAKILTAQPIQVSKVRMISMKSKMRKFSRLLQQYRDHEFEELSEVVDFNSGPAYQNLLGKELERLAIDTDRDDWEPPKWAKPISLSTLNGGRRRNQPVRAASPLEFVPDDDDAEIILEKNPSTSNKNSKGNYAGSSSVATRAAGRDSPYLSNKNDRDNKMDLDEPLLDPFDAIKEEKKDCPICGKLFSAELIENHASACTDFPDVSEDPVEPRPRQTRATAAATKQKAAPRSRQNNFDEDSRGNGPHLAAGKTTKNPVMEMEEDEEVADPDWAEVDNDSDFEPEDSGKKRNNRGQDAGKGKKRRL